MKRTMSVSVEDETAQCSKKRVVTYRTFQKWQRDFDKEFSTMSWLDCEARMNGGNKIVEKLKCKVCTKFESKIEGRKNFSNKWIVGAESVRASNVRDHAQNDQHAQSMILLKKDKAKAVGLGPASYPPIARALNKLPDDEKQRLRFKFDIAHFVATERLSYLKYPQICELERHHGVDLGTSYNNESAGKTFVHYIAESRRHELADHIKKAKFFSLLLDGSTDKGNIDNELLLIVWCDADGTDEKIHTKRSYFSVYRPESVSAEGLFAVVGRALQNIGIRAITTGDCKRLVGFGTDGASANIAAKGLKGLVEKKTPLGFLDVVPSTSTRACYQGCIERYRI